MELNEFWEGLKDPAVPLLEQAWPEPKRLAFAEALREIETGAYDKLATTFRIAREFNEVPILAVAGPINGGKSSLVGTFLSPESRDRIPMGLASREGTQRFVLWIPASWAGDAALYARLESMLALVFEGAPERLADDPASAREQYADVGGFARPLIGADSHLDGHGIALMDCPDMQRLQENESEGENLRMEAIARASEISSGVIIVTPRAQLEIRDLAELVRQRIPQAVRIYAVNLIRPPEAPESVYEELRRALKTDARILCYGAYDFLVPSSQEFVPEWDDNFSRPEGERAPCFFQIEPEAEQNRTGSIDTDRSIHRLAERVRPSVMRQKRQRELVEDLIGQVREGVALLEKRAEADRERMRRAVDELYGLARDLMHDADGRLRIKMDPAIVMSFKESMERTAPVHLKPLMALRRRTVDRAMAAVRQGREAMARAFPWIRAGGGRYEKLKSRLQKQLIQEKDIETLLDRWAVAARVGAPERTWQEEARDILERYREEERTNMAADDWDRIARQIWQNTGKLEATIRIFGSFFAGLAAVILIPFDGGASVLGITALELLGVLGLGGLVATGTLSDLEEEMKAKIGYRQLSNFLAIAGDRLGLPREPIEGVLEAQHLFKPNMEVEIFARSFGVREAGWRLCRVNPEARKKLIDTLDRWKKENHVPQTA